MERTENLVDFEMFLKETLHISGGLNLDEFSLTETPHWDSMSQLVISAWIHQETGNVISVEELKSAKTIGDLKAIYVSKV